MIGILGSLRSHLKEYFALARGCLLNSIPVRIRVGPIELRGVELIGFGPSFGITRIRHQPRDRFPNLRLQVGRLNLECSQQLKDVKDHAIEPEVCVAE